MRTINSLPVLFMLLISCSRDDNQSHSPVADSTEMRKDRDTINGFAATEKFVGRYDDQEVIFKQKNYQTYTLTMGDLVTSGSMNTERGYGDDRDATVYVLDFDKP